MPHGTPEQIAEQRKRYRQTHQKTYRGKNRRAKTDSSRASEQRRRSRQRIERHTFLGIDGEGWNTGDVHNYHMIVTSNPDLYLSSLSPLTTEQCLRFIGSIQTKASQHIVSFFFDYDVTMILRDLAQSDPDLCKALFMDQLIGYVWVYGDIGIKYVPHKHFTVKIGDAKPVTIHDTQGYFQSSFVTALRKFEIADDATITAIEKMKAQRDVFTESQSDDVRRYSLSECELLVKLIERVRDLATRAKLNPYPYEGPGGLASRAMARGYGRTAHSQTMDAIPERMREPITWLMYGGRFETLACGRIRRHVREYDRHSAYPAIMADLPCFRHGEWKRSRTIEGRYAFAYIEFNSRIEPSPGMCYPLPIRSYAGSLHYPRNGAGWYWEHEYMNDPNLRLTVGERWVWVPGECNCEPFAWARDLFAEREDMEREHKGSGIVLKLTLNTLYGKTAQTKPKMGPWCNLIYASIITSQLRTDMYSLYMQCEPMSVFMFATDAIFTSDRLPVTHGLGGLELADEYDNLTIVQPGLYFDQSQAHYKTRGIPKKYVQQYGEDIQLFAEYGLDYPMKITQFHGMRLALANNRPELIGQWTEDTRILRTRQASKRCDETKIGNIIYTVPRANHNPDGLTKPRTDVTELLTQYADTLNEDERYYE